MAIENGEQEKLQLLSSAFIWVEHVFISSVHQNFYHIYILHRASISVSCFASPVSENILSYVFFFFNARIHPLIRAYQSHFLAGTLICI